MGKKSGKKRDSFLDRLTTQLENGDISDLASEAEQLGLSSETFKTDFEKASQLVKQGMDPREVATLAMPFQKAFLMLAEREQDDEQINDLIELTDSQEIKKEGKRILHHMRSRGLKVDLPAKNVASILERTKSVDEPALPGYLSPITITGSRMIWLARYVRGGVGVYQAEISDQDGLTEFGGGVMGRSRYRSLFKDILNTPQASILEVSYAEVRQMLAKAVDISRANSKSLPEGYLEASANLPEDPNVPKAMDARELYPLQDMDPNAISGAASLELLELKEFADWTPEEDVLKNLQNKFQEIETSLVTINQEQRAELVQNALDQAVEEMLDTEEKRKRYQDRIFDMVLFFHRIGQPDLAKKVANFGWQLSKEPINPLDNLFFVHLVRRMFKSPKEIAEQMKAKTESETPNPKEEPEKSTENLIVTP